MSNVTFNIEDLGFIAQVAWSETEQLPLLDPKYDHLAEIAGAFEYMALGREAATWDAVRQLLDNAKPFDVWEDIRDLLILVAQEQVS